MLDIWSKIGRQKPVIHSASQSLSWWKSLFVCWHNCCWCVCVSLLSTISVRPRGGLLMDICMYDSVVDAQKMCNFTALVRGGQKMSQLDIPNASGRSTTEAGRSENANISLIGRHYSKPIFVVIQWCHLFLLASSRRRCCGEKRVTSGLFIMVRLSWGLNN